MKAYKNISLVARIWPYIHYIDLSGPLRSTVMKRMARGGGYLELGMAFN